ncbi:hypothetical protein [Streptomyces lincolnensis]|uniref:hypothetical protein n=1 Tax=Streptomyces lincolnensis TaxID=1915 RepID=UPI000834B6E0|nr:hypothetical protein [Streptomyces lincolnensis]QMV04726.1 hypothetical protein GJU35_02955 [Streptomyces lincolnensis]
MRFRTAGPSPEFDKLEKATAVADGECVLASHVPAGSLAVQRALAHYRDEAVRRARAVLAETARSRTASQSSSSTSGS